jgi:hypothetical protein
MYSPNPNSRHALRAHLLPFIPRSPPQPDFIVTLDQHGRVVSSRQVQAPQPQPQPNYQQPRRRRGIPQLFALTRDPECDFMDMARESLRDMDARIAALRNENENERVPSPMNLWSEWSPEDRFPSPQTETPGERFPTPFPARRSRSVELELEERFPTPLPARRSVTPEAQSSPSSSSSRPGTRPAPKVWPSSSPSPSPSPSPPRTRHAAVAESASASPEEATPTPTPQSSEQDDLEDGASDDGPGDFASQKQAIRVELLRLSLDLSEFEGKLMGLRAALYSVLDKVTELGV